MQKKYKILILVVIVLAIILTPFIISVVKFIDKFENAVVVDKTDSVVKLKYLVAYNLLSKKEDTIALKGINVINYWTYYCAPCIEEIPMLENVNNKYRVILFTKDSSKNTLYFLRNKKVKLDAYYYTDTTIFGNADVVPRTLILKDSVIKSDVYAKIDKSEIQFIAMLDSLSSH
jgi:thiol-disulfide isomerase/thioredoxin